jgi:hypothetical protein
MGLVLIGTLFCGRVGVSSLSLAGVAGLSLDIRFSLSLAQRSGGGRVGTLGVVEVSLSLQLSIFRSRFMILYLVFI